LNDHPRKKWSSKPQLSRKEARKQDRVGRKQRKAEFFSAVPTSTKRHAQDEHADSPKRKKAKLEPAVLSTNDSRTSSINKHNPPANSSRPIPLAREAKAKKLKPSTQPKTALEKLVRGSNLILKSSPRSQKEKDEDAYIAYLESKLGYAEGSKRKKGSEDDGLDGVVSNAFGPALCSDLLADLMDLASSLVTSHQQEQVRAHSRLQTFSVHNF
jgi:nucleolar MIF4G domain-containing protein 1